MATAMAVFMLPANIEQETDFLDGRPISWIDDGDETRRIVGTRPTSMYITGGPCSACAQLLNNCGRSGTTSISDVKEFR